MRAGGGTAAGEPHRSLCHGRELLASGKRFDIVFLDIQMEGMNGIEAARGLRERREDTVLVFVTGIKDYVFDAFDCLIPHLIDTGNKWYHLSRKSGGKDMLEELRFLLICRFDSTSPMSLVLVGQTELWEQKLKLQAYEAIRQRIDMNIVLGRLDRAETGKYVATHMAYAGAGKEIFTSGAEDEVYKISAGIPRMINRVCEKALMYACQQQKRLVDEHMVRFVADYEMLGGVG